MLPLQICDNLIPDGWIGQRVPSALLCGLFPPGHEDFLVIKALRVTYTNNKGKKRRDRRTLQAEVNEYPVACSQVGGAATGER